MINTFSYTISFFYIQWLESKTTWTVRITTWTSAGFSCHKILFMCLSFMEYFLCFRLCSGRPSDSWFPAEECFFHPVSAWYPAYQRYWKQGWIFSGKRNSSTLRLLSDTHSISYRCFWWKLFCLIQLSLLQLYFQALYRCWYPIPAPADADDRLSAK